MVRTDIEVGKDQDENKNIINAQAPFHQVGTDIFKCLGLSTFPP
jgi:hypothetical protein